MWLNCWVAERTVGPEVLNQCALLPLWTQLGTWQSHHGHQWTHEVLPFNVCFIARLSHHLSPREALTVKTLRSIRLTQSVVCRPGAQASPRSLLEMKNLGHIPETGCAFSQDIQVIHRDSSLKGSGFDQLQNDTYFNDRREEGLRRKISQKCYTRGEQNQLAVAVSGP